MLNSINNSSPSFGAYLEYKGMTDEFGKDLSESSQVKIVNEGVASDMVKFLEFINTKEGKKILDKLPKEDVIEFTAQYKPHADSTKLLPSVRIHHKGAYSDPITLNTSDKSTTNAFIEWVDDTVENQKKSDSREYMLNLLTTPFTINSSEGQKEGDTFFTTPGDLKWIPECWDSVNKKTW
mgnify:CR=1 FL=1